MAAAGGEGATATDANEKAGLRSVLFKSLYNKSSRIKDCLLSITNRCSECGISNFCENQNDFAVLLKVLNSNSLELIQDSFITTPFTRKIVNTSWAPEATLITFRQRTSIITEEECDEVIKKKLISEGVEEKEFTKAQVEVRQLNLDWLLSDKKNFVNFVNILQTTSSEQIYDTELIGTLLDEFWEENY